jgi:FtsP/CotA-like multicopper oxidase with cupredoxin domain
MSDQSLLFRRRQLLKLSAAGAGFAALGGMGLLSAQSVASRLMLAGAGADSVYIEAWPTSPLVKTPFVDPLPVPQALRPIPQSTWQNWVHWQTGKPIVPGPQPGSQDDMGQSHQIWPSQLTYQGKAMPDPLIYQIKLQLGLHYFTSSDVLPINSSGQPSFYFKNGQQIPVTASSSGIKMPGTTGYMFNGTFPGPRVNNAYGQPVILRFENHLNENPGNLPRGDFGSPEYGFLTHLHNSHTAPESDGNPHYRANQRVNGRQLWDYTNPRSRGYLPGEWVDNLYLNYPAGGNDREKQSFFWFHDHFHNHTGADVYKGMVGVFPLYDPGSPSLGANFSDYGDETSGLRLPGVRTDNGDGSFDVDYDIPLVFYDVRIEDGITPHKDFHNGNGELHPEWWGTSYFRHFPNHGFVGDLFTVNGTAFPVMEVKRRKYRFRFLDASISRIYDFNLMSSTGGPKAAKDLGYIGDELQGQYRLPDGQQCMRMLQIATGGGLLPNPVYRDHFELWPATRREVIIDFSHYQNGQSTSLNDVIYLVNSAKMPDGREPTSPDPAYKIPMVKFIITEDAADNSLPMDQLAKQPLRPMPVMLDPNGNVCDIDPSSGKPNAALQAMIDNRRQYTLQRGGNTNTPPGNLPNDNEWSINGHPFDETINVLDQKGRPSTPKRGVPEVWEIINGGGGWVHPMHIHMEEHHVLFRNGKPAATWQSNPTATDSRHVDDTGKDDVVQMDPSESVMFYRNFRTFAGKYVAHCHNLAHEDHAMMFGWEIIP